MRIIAWSTLKKFYEQPDCEDAKAPLTTWNKVTESADWAAPADVKATFGNASILKDGRAVFNIAGNKYRIIVWINYEYRVVYIRFVGTHKQYGAVDTQTI